MQQLPEFIDFSSFLSPQKTNFIWDYHEAMSIDSPHLSAIFAHLKDPSICDSEQFLKWKSDADLGSAEEQYYVAVCFELGSGTQLSYDEAIKYYKLSAEQGNTTAMVDLGMIFQKKTSKQSNEQAFYWFKLAANNGNPLGEANLGRCYENGFGVSSSIIDALHYYQLSANHGCVLGYTELARLYADGIGVEQSNETANSYYLKAFEIFKSYADQGSAKYQLLVGNYFENGLGIEQSLDLAICYYQLSANQNYSSAQLALAECYKIGKGIKQSDEKAFQFYKLAADQGNIFAQESLAYYLDAKDRYEEAIYYWKLLLHSTHCPEHLRSIAQSNLGYHFHKGLGVKQSNQNALYYYQLAAIEGEYMAQYSLGMGYLRGELGLEQSSEKAVYYLELAANQGSPHAQYYLGECYENGIGVIKSIDKAVFYYTCAAKQDDELAQYSLACINDQARKYEEAFHYWKLLSEQDKESYPVLVARAQAFLGRYFEYGLGVTQSPKRAVEYYQSAAENKNNMAVMALGMAYRNGELGLKRSFKKAVYYFKLAADQGSAYGQNNLGKCYEHGNGVKKSSKQAFYYYKLAAEQGDKYDLAEVGRCFQHGIGVEKSLKKAIRYYQLAAEKGLKSAYKDLANCILEENGENAEQFYAYYYKLSFQE